MTHDEQIEQWVKGNPLHGAKRADAPPEEDGDCCPDFSCCVPVLLAPPKVREAYAVANEGDRMKYLGGFLSSAMEEHAKNGKKADVYIAGQGPDDA